MDRGVRLGVDVGTVRVGVAACDPDGIMAFPVATVARDAAAVATIAALAAMGTAAPQLKVHIEAGLNVGLSQEEVTEILMQMAVYAGFPAALNGLFAAKEVFAARRDAAAAA